MGDGRVRITEEMVLAASGETWPTSQVTIALDLLDRHDGRFPSGLRRLPTDLVRTVQRVRLLAGMLQACAEVGYRAANVQAVIERAGLSRPTFYEHFENKEDCFLMAFDFAARQLREQIDAGTSGGGTSEDGGDFREWLGLGLGELLRFAAADPDAARTLIVEARAGSAAALQRHRDLFDDFVSCIDARARMELPSPPPASTAVGVVGGIEAVLCARLNGGRVDELPSLLPSLTSFALLAYEGPRSIAATE